MTKTETIHVRVNGNVKRQAEKTLNVLGVSISEAVNMLLHQVALVGGMPFDVRIPQAPASVIYSSKEELYEKLNAGLIDILEGRVVSADMVAEQLRAKYGFQD